MDGRSHNASINLHTHMVSSQNIEALFKRHNVPTDVDYVSIDIDSADLWVMRSLMASSFKPRVVSVEYNAFLNGEPTDALAVMLTLPDPSTMPVLHGKSGWERTCYFGSAGLALVRAAQALGYVLVAGVRHHSRPRLGSPLPRVPATAPPVPCSRRGAGPARTFPSSRALPRQVPYLDLFFARADLWPPGRQPFPSAAEALEARVEDAFAGFHGHRRGMNWHRAMWPEQAANLVDFSVWQETGNVTAARTRAAQVLQRLKTHHRQQNRSGACFRRIFI